ncbi:MAG: N-ethylammeline chlorohydrolase [Gammaproteobacteria bacterium CG_4_10_14_0_8_um_filter_38_16]|nr:MAG: N-ethylammeline chlorohydrolase [Gammaproteobacteria bacterium CG_4_10_14_0_8_um_filter_38_16]PJA04203.1 MAG: N-ethylammeline chlorohydrolase [Gammaproteobacteria bacterium CG_4_10_14_0_2_um_filter_38_22]PJB11039.1 MAG: N-ethylammeline chlorohydrolase [Gammaproteobacteria bacterium CG_4_9_14_3_um_filter_38_9]
MHTIDTLIHARWIVPVVPRNQVLEHHTIAIQNGKIIDLLPTKSAKEKYTAKNDIDRSNCVVMPGLINTHAHTPMNLLRGLADDLQLMDWLQNHIWPAEAKLLHPESVYDGSMLAIIEMLRGGTTCFNDHYFYPNDTARAAVHAGMRATIGLWVGNAPTGWAKDANECLTKAKTEYENRPNSPLITYALAPHSPYITDDDSLLKTKQFADEKNLPIHIHLHETQAEIHIDLEKYGKRPMQRFHELGLLNERLIAVHMVHLTDAEIELCAETKLHVSHNPESNLKLASGFAPISKLLKAGVNVCLGTDGAASNNDLDLFAEMQTAALIAKGVSQDPTVLDAMTALEMATINGAKALGLANEIGSIEIGKSADVIAIDFDHFFTQPVFHPISHLVYAMNRIQVSDVFIAGKQILNRGEFVTLDVNEIVAKANKWAMSIAANK